MKITKRAFFATIALIPFAMFAGMNTANAEDMGAENKVVIQISSGNPADQKLALDTFTALFRASF